MAEKKRKWGILDIIVILGVLVVIGGAVFYFTHNSVGDSAMSSGTCDITYVLEFKDAPADIEDRIVIGDEIYEAEAGVLIGTVEAVEIRPYVIDEYKSETGMMGEAEVEDLHNAQITVSASAVVSESATTVNDVDVMVGSGVNFYTSTFGGSGYCVKLEEPGYDH